MYDIVVKFLALFTQVIYLITNVYFVIQNGGQVSPCGCIHWYGISTTFLFWDRGTTQSYTHFWKRLFSVKIWSIRIKFPFQSFIIWLDMKYLPFPDSKMFMYSRQVSDFIWRKKGKLRSIKKHKQFGSLIKALLKMKSFLRSIVLNVLSWGYSTEIHKIK